MNSGKSKTSGRKPAKEGLKKFVTLWVLVSFIMSSCPAYANREDRLEASLLERQERRAERILQRGLEPRLTRQLANPQLAPIFQQATNSEARIHDRINSLDHSRIAQELVTSRRDLRTENPRVPTKTVQDSGTGRARNVNLRLNLDLSSSQKNIRLGEKLFSNTSGAVTINVGGEQQTFSAGSKVTAAQYASILQEINGGQALVLDGKGTAEGGTLDFQTLTASGDNLKLSSLVIPEQVAALGNFSNSSDVQLKGDVINYGSIHAIANRDGGTKATIATNNLYNKEGAIISSVPSSSLGSDLANSVDLSLRAQDTLSNQGKIESSGDLTLSAGAQVLNGDERGRGNSSATVTAQNNLYIHAPVVTNSGLLQSTEGNINFTAPVGESADGSIAVNSENGTVQALKGNIDFRDSSASGKPLTTITGGKWNAKELNLWGGEGTVKVDAQSISATVSMHTGIGQVSSREGDLRLGEMVTTGDPLVKSAGDITITANVTTGGGPLTYIAGQNIFIDPNVVITSSGGTILMVAGALYEDPNGVHPTETWITGGSATGGFIFGQNATIDSSSTGNAGNIQLIAYDGSIPDEGIYLGDSTVTATGGAGAANGNISMIARYVEVDSVDNGGAGSTAGTGNVTIASFNPTITGAAQVRIDETTGAILGSGTFSVGTAPTTVGDVFINSTLNAGNNFQLTSSNSAFTSDISASASVTISTAINVFTGLISVGNDFSATTISGTASFDDITGTSVTDVLVTAGGQAELALVTANTVSVAAGDDVVLFGSLSAPSGISLVSGRNIFAFNPGVTISSASAIGGGDIVMVAGATFTADSNDITITGATVEGGTIDFDLNNVVSLDSRGTAGNTSGGDIKLAVFGGNVNAGGVFMDSITSITSGGSGSGSNGDLTVIAGGSVGNTIGVIGPVNTTGGSGAAGDVFMSTSTPQTGVIIDRGDATTNTTFAGGALQTGNLFSGTISAGAGTITLEAGNDATLGAMTTTSGTISASAGGALNAAAAINAGSASLTLLSRTDNLTFGANLTARGGILMVTGGDIVATLAGLTVSTSGTGNSGDITLIAGAAYTSTSTNVTITGASTTGGQIDFDFNNTSITSRSTAAGGVGGDVTLVGFDGTANLGRVLTDATTTIFTGGNGSGANGSVVIVAGNDNNFAVNIGNVDTTGGAANTGDITIRVSTPDTSPNVILQKSTASVISGNFATNPVIGSDVGTGALTVSNQADITVNGGDLLIGSVTGGANSQLSLTSNTGFFIDLAGAAIGNVSLTSGANLFAGALTMGASGTLNATATGLGQFQAISGGTASISVGGTLALESTVSVSSVAALAVDDISIGADITAPAGILLVSGHNIYPGNFDTVDLSTASSVSNAGDITIVAGAAFTDNGTSVTITGASATGGFIDFDTDKLRTISSRSTAANGSGGDVTMIAFDGSEDTGYIFTDFEESVITTGGSGSGANGSFTAVAGATQNNGIGIRGFLNTAGGNASTGDVYIAASTPDTTPNVTIQKSSASISAGDFKTSGTTTASSVFVDFVTVGNGADVTIASGADVFLDSVTAGASSILSITSGLDTNVVTTNAGTVAINAGQDVFVSGALNQGAGSTSVNITAARDMEVALINSGNVRLNATTGNIFLGGPTTASGSVAASAGQFIDLNNDVTAPGGILLVAGRSITPNSTGVDLLTTTSGSAGDLTIIAGAAFTQNAGTITITGASSTGGSIDFDFVALNSIDTRSTGGNGAGGDVTMVAFAGSDPFTGAVFTNPAPSFISTGGNGSGANGNFTAIGNATTGSGVGVRGTLDTTGGQAGTGNVWLAAATPVTSTAVVIQKSNGAITTGDFRNGAIAPSDVFADQVTVSNGATVNINCGANVVLDTVTAGAASTLTIGATGSVQINSTNAGTATITAGTTINAGDFLQGTSGSLTISSVSGNTTIDEVVSGNVRIQTGGFLTLGNTIGASGSFSAVATNSIVLFNDISAAGGILLVSGHDIAPGVSGVVDLSSINFAGNSGDITVIAGAAFTQNSTQVTITGASATGGAIDFDFNAVNSIFSAGATVNGAGGDVTLVAFLGSDATGFVSTDALGAISTGGLGSGANGDLTIVAGNNAATAVNLGGGILTTGGASATGNIWIASATPLTTPNVVVSKVTAAITSGDFRNGALTGGDIFAGNLTAAPGATINIQTGGFASLGNLNGGANSSLRVSAVESVDIGSINVGNASVLAGTFMRLNGNILASGGLLLVSGGDIFPNAANLAISTNSSTADAGDLTIIAGAAFTQNAGSVTITGASATGGRIDLDFNNVTGVTANSTFAGGDGGDITIVSLFGSADTGEIFTDTNTVINAGGNGAGSNGSITLVSSKNSGFDGIVLNRNLTLQGGAQGTGSINLSTSALGGNVTLSKSTGSVTSGTFLGGTAVNSGIDTLNLTVRGGDIIVSSGAEVTLGTVDVSGNINGIGGLIDITTRSSDTLTLGATGLNSVAALTAKGGSASGAGGEIRALSTGAGGITIAGLLDVSATEGNGGIIDLEATTGDLTLAAGVSSLNASAGTASATARTGGSISLIGNNIGGTNSIQLLANGVAGGNGGAVSVTTNTGDINVGTGAGQIIAQANGTGGIISYTANGGGHIVVNLTGTTSSATVNLSSAAGTITNNGSITGTSAINLSVGGANTISGTGSYTGGSLSVTAGTGSSTLTTTVASLTLNTNGNVNLTETDDLTVNAGGTGNGQLAINVTGDDLTFGGALTANGGFVLTTSGAGTIGGAGVLSSSGQLSVTAGTGSVSLNTNVASFTASTTSSPISITETNNITLNNIVGSSLTVTAGNGIAHGSGIIDADSVDLSALSGDIGASANPIVINNGASPVTLVADATGDIYITIQGSGPLFLGQTAADDITIVSSAPITTTADISATGTLNITTDTLNFEDDTLSANIINILSNFNSGLTLNGGTNGGVMQATTSINITATFGDLDLNGKQDYFGPTTMTAVAALDASINVNSGADIVGHNSLTLVTTTLNQIGSIVGNPLIMANQFFTIANSTGDVDLGGDIVFQGQSFAILARGNINIQGALDLIDLSDGTGDGGSLFMAAGYDFTPATPGQLTTPAQFTLAPNNQSTIGGSINLSAATINLSSVTGDAGSLTAIATSGSSNSGGVNLGNVNVSAVGGSGGNVLIIGEGGVTVGNINAQGTVADGDVHVAVATPNVQGGNILVTNGDVTGGTFQSTALAQGNMVTGTITADNVTLRGASAVGNTIAQTAGGEVNASTLSVEVGSGSAALDTNIGTLNASGNGTIDLNQTGDLQLGTLASSLDALTLNVVSDAVITTPAGGINDVANLSLEGNAGAGQTAVVLNGPLSTYNSLSVTAVGGADILINNLTLTSATINLTSTAGDVVIGATGVLNASTQATVNAFDGFTVAGTINTQTVSLTSGDSILTSDITGNITAPAGTFLISTNGGIGLDANNRFVTNSAQLQFQAGGGGVFISATNTTGVEVLDIAAATEVDIIAAGPVTLHDVASANGDIRIVQNGVGTFTVQAGATITSTEGDIILQNLDINKKTGKIVIDDGANIKGSGTTAGVGQVFIFLGQQPVQPYGDKKKPPKGVTVNEVGGGGVYLGKKSIDVKKETNIVLNALGVDLVFGLAEKMNKKNIHVGSNVTITADPPWHTVPATTLDLSSQSRTSAIAAEATDEIANNIASISANQPFAVPVSQPTLTTAIATDMNAAITTPVMLSDTAVAREDALSLLFGDEETENDGIIDARLVADLPQEPARNRGSAAGAKSMVNATMQAVHSLDSGSAIYAPSRDVTVRAGQTEIAISGGSVVLVMNSGNVASVFDLHDTKKGAVKVSFHGQTHSLSPGRHASMSQTEKRAFADANLAELILHRGVNNVGTAHGGTIFTSEFLVNSALDCVPALRKMMSASEPSCIKIAEKLTKTQAVLLHLFQSKEEFQKQKRAQVAAMR